MDADDALEVYRANPMSNGDVAFIMAELRMVQEVQGLADAWDPVLRRNTGALLRELGVRELCLAVARPDAELLAQDHVMWAELQEELRGTGISLLPPQGLPAAA
ncbi:MAG: hypothetical protein ABR549_04995 [Mycobacteriales bacterium]